MSEKNASFRGIEELGRIAPNDSIRLEPFLQIPAIPRSPFSASISPSDDAVSNEEDLYDGHGSTVATHAESDQGRSGWISDCLLWFVSCRRCWRKEKYESEYIVLFSNASDLGSRACLLSGESLNQHVVSFVSRTVICILCTEIACFVKCQFLTRAQIHRSLVVTDILQTFHTK